MNYYFRAIKWREYGPDRIFKKYVMENEDDMYALAMEAMPDSFQDEFLRVLDEYTRLSKEMKRALHLAGMEQVLEMLEKYDETIKELETLVCNAMFVYGADIMSRS